ncbi:hypothetical protein P280DRAFT_412295 [Massarina eburnea CBS 473.64]|uniref:Survival Motor Neuron Gemin2-binding domain-containing protein n=1 Tax=Massarina eburnea CBS 473.64 TaxID=1395130 RepID=A0A6A6RIG8_9PLEO|nr:hypothetical protein P280DRAFT_412295 [Massarina eburnea CBS 473.64]
MAPGISLDDRSAWDDSALINSWDDAVNEYEKYHSIQRSGKRLEDVLGQEELGQLREEHGDVMEDAQTRSSVADRNNHADHEKAAQPQKSTNGNDVNGINEAHAEEQAVSGPVETGMHEPIAGSMPQALLGTVQDEKLRNLMMSWYYAGYYTGLHTGQQQSTPNATSK